MLENEISDAALSKVWHFTVGFARAGETPAAKGSGVLVKYKGLMGILTCGHVDTYVRSLKQPIGLVRFNRGLAEQFGAIDLDEVFSHVAGEEPWERGSDDIAFINLPPHLVGNIAKDCVFLDIERNFTRPDPDSRSELLGVHAVFGLVEAFTGETTRQNKRATTRLRGVFTPGRLLQIDHLNATLECFEENIPALPDSFGGTSGGGLWRVYVRKRDDGVFEAEHYRLLGIASREDIALTPPQIACQGPGRIEMLLESVHSSS